MSLSQNEKIANLYDVARQAKKCDDFGTALKYYNMLLNEDPFSWEPVFYSVYYTVSSMKNGEIANKAFEINTCLNTALSMISKRIDSKYEQMDALLELKDSTTKVAVLLKTSYDNFYNHIPAMTRSETDKLNKYIGISDILFTMGDGLYSFEGGNIDLKSDACEVYKKAISIIESNTSLASKFYRQNETHPTIDKIRVASQKIKEFDPSYQTILDRRAEQAQKEEEKRKAEEIEHAERSKITRKSFVRNLPLLIAELIVPAVIYIAAFVIFGFISSTMGSSMFLAAAIFFTPVTRNISPIFALITILMSDNNPRTIKTFRILSIVTLVISIIITLLIALANDAGVTLACFTGTIMSATDLIIARKRKIPENQNEEAI